MKWAEISIQTSHEATEAVANIFHDLGSSGVVIEDPELVNVYRRSGAWEFCDIPEAENTEIVTVKAYLPADGSLQEKMRIFEERINSLADDDLDKGEGTINLREIQDEDWESSWKAYFHTTKVGNRIVIKPTWETYEQSPEEIVIKIDPGMAFGTGTHHTTSMCIRVLEDLIEPGMSVFDVGTGSGILAIAAAKLGAGDVQAVDFDSTAVKVASDNVALNEVDDIVKVGKSDLLQAVHGSADVIVANIIADIIIRLLDDVPDYLKHGGALLASGIIADRVSDVTEKALAGGFSIDAVAEEGGWAAILMRREVD